MRVKAGYKWRPWLSTNDVQVRVIKTQGRVSAVSVFSRLFNIRK